MKSKRALVREACIVSTWIGFAEIHGSGLPDLLVPECPELHDKGGEIGIDPTVARLCDLRPGQEEGEQNGG